MGERKCTRLLIKIFSRITTTRPAVRVRSVFLENARRVGSGRESGGVRSITGRFGRVSKSNGVDQVALFTACLSHFDP